MTASISEAKSLYKTAPSFRKELPTHRGSLVYDRPYHEPRPGEDSGARRFWRAHHMDHIEAVARSIHEFVSARIPNCADAADIAQEVLTIACSDANKLARRKGDALFAIAQKAIDDYY